MIPSKFDEALLKSSILVSLSTSQGTSRVTWSQVAKRWSQKFWDVEKGWDGFSGASKTSKTFRELPTSFRVLCGKPESQLIILLGLGISWVDWERGTFQSFLLSQDHVNLFLQSKSSFFAAIPEFGTKVDSRWRDSLSTAWRVSSSILNVWLYPLAYRKFFVIHPLLDNLLCEVFGRFSSSYWNFQIICVFFWARSAHWPAWCSSNLCDSSRWFHGEQYQIFLFPIFSVHLHVSHWQSFLSCTVTMQSSLCFLFQGIREDSFFLSLVEIMTHFRNHNSLFLLVGIVQHFWEDSSLRCSIPQLPTLDFCQRCITLDDAGFFRLPLATACWKNGDSEGICTSRSSVNSGEVNCLGSMVYVMSDATMVGTSLLSVVKLFFLETKFIGVYSLEISTRSLGSWYAMGLCSAIRPNNEPLRGSTQVEPDSVTSVVGKRGGGGSGTPSKLR